MKIAVMTNHSELCLLRDLAQTAEELGLHMMSFPDHLVDENSDGSVNRNSLMYDSMLCAAVIAEATQTLRFGQLVTNNLLRHPVVTAQDFMTLDRLSNGRVVAGMGAGWREVEFAMAGIPFPDLAARMEMLDESLTCMRSLWTEEETNFAGRHYQFKDAILYPKPVQDPHPPILLGGFAPQLIKLAAKHASYVNILFPMGRSGHPNVARLNETTFKEKVKTLRQQTEAFGRPRNAVKVVNLLIIIVISESVSEVNTAVNSLASQWGVTPEYVSTSPIALIGSPEQCALELKRRESEWEVDTFVFGCTEPQALQAWIESLQPHLQ